MLRYVDQWCCRACPEFRASNFSKAQHLEFFFFHIICRGEFWALFASLLQRLETSEDADRQLSCSCDRAWLGQRQKLSQRYQRESHTTFDGDQRAEQRQVQDYPEYGFPLLQDANNTDLLFPMPACHGYVIAEKSIEELQEYMTSGNLTSVQLTTCYLQRQFQTHDYLKYVLIICKTSETVLTAAQRYP